MEEVYVPSLLSAARRITSPTPSDWTVRPLRPPPTKALPAGTISSPVVSGGPPLPPVTPANRLRRSAARNKHVPVQSRRQERFFVDGKDMAL
jgi:hypothetical protein